MNRNLSEQPRFDFIEAEIDRAYVHADDEWKQAYYENAAKYLSEHKLVEGGKICAFCRSQGMSDPNCNSVVYVLAAKHSEEVSPDGTCFE